jgi:hypothetical protein
MDFKKAGLGKAGNRQDTIDYQAICGIVRHPFWQISDYGRPFMASYNTFDVAAGIMRLSPHTDTASTIPGYLS